MAVLRRMRIAAIVGALLALVLPSTAARAVGSTTVQTTEAGCYEFNQVTLVPLATLRASVPDRYGIRPSAQDPTKGSLIFTDYACDSLTVDGLTWPHRSIVTMGLVAVSTRDGASTNARYVVWHGTNNAYLAHAMRGLGMPSRTVRADDVLASVDAAHTLVVMRFRGAHLDHGTVALATEPPAEPVVQLPSLPFYHVGPHGEVLLTYDNRFTRATARTFLTVGAKSVPAALGVPTTLSPADVPFSRGEWDGTAVLP